MSFCFTSEPLLTGLPCVWVTALFPLLTSAAFFSDSSSFSWASFRPSENLSSSSSVCLSFFWRSTSSSSSCNRAERQSSVHPKLSTHTGCHKKYCAFVAGFAATASQKMCDCSCCVYLTAFSLQLNVKKSNISKNLDKMLLQFAGVSIVSRISFLVVKSLPSKPHLKEEGGWTQHFAYWILYWQLFAVKNGCSVFPFNHF